jgi:hypothetical protein
MPVYALKSILAAALWLSAPAPSAQPPARAAGPAFETSDRCLACHNGLHTSAGEDISIGFQWSASMMANSARDPYWQAGVRRETLDHPSAAQAIEAECSICHMPMARYEAWLAGGEGQVFAHTQFDPGVRADRLAADGVSCSLCHQIAPDKLGARESFVGRFVIAPGAAGLRTAFGRFAVDAGRARIMSSSSGFRPTQSEHVRKSELCATCHTLYTHSLDRAGKVLAEFPEQVPYQEWLHSDYRQGRGCQDCHMPAVSGPAPIAAVLGQPREGVARHSFPGGNFFLQRLLNRFRNELAVAAAPQALEGAALRTLEHLGSEAARLSIENVHLRGGRLEADIRAENLGGHKLPTAYPSRRVWLHLLVRDGGGRVVFESGALTAEGAIQGNDNDADPRRWEPHYREIRSAEQVQIYEAVMGDSSGAPTTGLLSAVRYLKDNRLLPRGFNKRTADKDIAVWGEAAEDEDFTGGGDRLHMSVAVAGAEGPLRIEAELWYQPIAYRWAANLAPYQTAETRRFARYFQLMAPDSAAVLARASATQ